MPSSESEVDIINAALFKIGDQRITSRGDNNNRARLMNGLYDGVRDELLRDCPWNFAVQRASISASTTVPVYEWETSFPIPADLLYMVSTENFTAYRLEGNNILSNQETTLKITYVRRVIDPTEFDTGFVKAFKAKLAYEAVSNIAADPQLQETLFRDYNLALTRAKATDGKEDDPREYA